MLTGFIMVVYENFFLLKISQNFLSYPALADLGTRILSIPCSFREILEKSCVDAPAPGELVPSNQGNPGSATTRDD